MNTIEAGAGSGANSPVFAAVTVVFLLLGAAGALAIASETNPGFLGRGFQLAVACMVLGAGVLGSALAGLIAWWRREEPGLVVRLLLVLDGLIGAVLLIMALR